MTHVRFVNGKVLFAGGYDYGDPRRVVIRDDPCCCQITSCCDFVWDSWTVTATGSHCSPFVGTFTDDGLVPGQCVYSRTVNFDDPPVTCDPGNIAGVSITATGSALFGGVVKNFYVQQWVKSVFYRITLNPSSIDVLLMWTVGQAFYLTDDPGNCYVSSFIPTFEAEDFDGNCSGPLQLTVNYVANLSAAGGPASLFLGNCLLELTPTFL